MTRLLLVRHGQSTWNAQGRLQGWADPPLDETGQEQARWLARRLAAEEQNISAIYSSPLLRARQTAEALGLTLGLSVQADDRLKENDVGLLAGLTGSEIEEKFPDWVAARRASAEWTPPPGGEDRDGFVSRAVAVMRDIAAHHPDQTVAVVSHGGTLGVYLAHLLEMPIHRSLPFQFDNASLSIVKVSERRVRLFKLNDTSHLSNGYKQLTL
jgi:broad specificity phosphatase PhoE